ncbi:hypothetical protein TPL01_30410 [Sulfuriferula plumbiphila]|uniref:Uncharacterized protein n=1 Tax=Sulfuriferula plumbiphila TaxID=171865 RepID=A0A512LBN8_9PROT|nr:hypothetical protein [Sulfuriferula plumbiphila]BBP03330.1 hypothetical protein SFPGR_07520 [Sulfuriferula plumbiphila]GEP31903.1 hypothetical protein TPL01_30410 [Sulfuriferula plumbiphila]
MNPALCYVRTPLGREELRQPKLGLKPRCRQLLFVLDGTLSVAQIGETMRGITDLEGTLQDMLQLGLICPSGEAPAQTSVAAASHDDLADKLDHAMHHSTDSGNRFEDAKHHAVDMMTALFGAKSSHVDKLAQANTQGELLAEVAKCKKILGAVASSSKAQHFEQSVLAALQK